MFAFMKVFILMFLFVSLITLSCRNDNVINHDVIDHSAFLDLSKGEIEVLKSVSIDCRNRKIIPVVEISLGDSSYIIPTADIGYSDSICLKQRYYLTRYMNCRGIDTAQTFYHLDTFTKNILKAFKKSNVRRVISIPSSGDFIVFIPYSGYEMVYKYSDKITNDIWKVFFDTAKMVKQDWYKGAPITNVLE